MGNINDMKGLSNIAGSIKKSLENLVEDESEPIVTFPDDTPVPSELMSSTNPMDTMKFEQTTTNNFSATKVRLFFLIISNTFLLKKHVINLTYLKFLYSKFNFDFKNSL